MPTTDISRPSTRYRSEIATGIAPKESAVSRDGGDHQAGLIRGYSVITRGEALGHGHWIDGTFLNQVADAINAAPDGIKARFAHPSLSADGLGSYLGRTKNAVVDGDTVRADLHLSPTAHQAPDGNLAEYVMDLAEVDPSAFGASIVFSRHKKQETQFALDNCDSEGNFVTPDEANHKNLRHVRLGALRASDVVDEPAANPNGMFHRQSIAHEAESLLSYAFGLSEDCLEMTSFDVDPQRVRRFAQSFLEQRGLKLTSLDAEPAQEPTAEPTETEEPPAAEPAADEESEEEEEPSEPAGNPVEPAAPELSVIASLQAEVEELRARLAALPRGEAQPLSFAADTAISSVDETKRKRLQASLGNNLGAYASALKLRKN